MKKEVTGQVIQGKGVFKQNTNKKLIQSQKIKLTLKGNLWRIDKKKYQRQNWKQVFTGMLECTTKEIFLGINTFITKIDYNDRPYLIKEIQHVHFSDLKQLWLSGNKINNIEPLSAMLTQNLVSLCLTNNQISRMQTWNKMSLPSLTKLFLCLNPITQINSITRSKTNPNEFRTLSLQIYSKQAPHHQDLGFCVKLSCKNIDNFFVRSKAGRIFQGKVNQVAKKRFPAIVISNWQLNQQM